MEVAHWESPGALCERNLSLTGMLEPTLLLWLSKLWGMSQSPGKCGVKAVLQASGLLIQGPLRGAVIWIFKEPPTHLLMEWVFQPCCFGDTGLGLDQATQLETTPPLTKFIRSFLCSSTYPASRSLLSTICVENKKISQTQIFTCQVHRTIWEVFYF